jgi:uncharacterized protein YecE (DUF72 family)
VELVTAALRVGCSGWSYKDWRGVVYPVELPRRLWFDHYQQLFDTVELNSTYYRLPRATTVEGWAAAARPGFVFAVKLGAFGSHRMKLRDAATWLPNHLDRIERLGDHLGPTLVQLPPRWKRNADRLDEFLGTAPATLRWAVELRDPSWIHDDVFEVLRRYGAALCIHDLLDNHPFELTTDWTYIRFHGPAALSTPYHGAYGPVRLDAWATRLGEVLDAGHDVYAYFNNDWFGHAVGDAAFLRRALTGQRSQRLVRRS